MTLMSTSITPRVSLSPALKDWRTLRDELLARAPILTNGRWTDLNPSDVGVGLSEMLIGMTDMLLYYLDRMANEVTFVNAVERKNVQNLLKLIGYELRGYTGSSGQVIFSVVPTIPPPVYPIVIPIATAVAGTADTGEDVEYYTLASVTLSTPSPGSPAVGRVNVVQGKPSTSPEVFQADGTGNQRYVIRTQNVSKALLTVKIGSSEQSAVVWTATDNLLGFQGNDKVFVPLLDSTGLAFIQFGDGKFGMVPQLGENIYTYPVTVSGESGNLAANVISRVLSDILDANGNKVSLIASNPIAMTGGSDPESIEDGKKNGPALFSALYRAMSKADYIALMENIPGVDKANAWGEQEELHPNIKLINRVTLVFTSLEPPTSLTYAADLAVLQQQIFDLLEERKPVTTRLVFKTPELVDVLVEVLVAVNRTLYDPAIVAADVRLAIQNEWNYINIEFGQDARLSLISRVISNVPGVSWAQVKLGRFPDVTPGFVDVPVSKWQLIRINDFDAFSNPVIGYDGSLVKQHITVTTTVNVDAPIPDPMPNPCALG